MLLLTTWPAFAAFLKKTKPVLRACYLFGCVACYLAAAIYFGGLRK